MLDGGLVLGPVTGTYYSLFQKGISNILTFTPSPFNQTRRITRHNVSVTRYKSVMKNGHDWAPASKVPGDILDYRPLTRKLTSDVNGKLPGIQQTISYMGLIMKQLFHA